MTNFLTLPRTGIARAGWQELQALSLLSLLNPINSYSISDVEYDQQRGMLFFNVTDKNGKTTTQFFSHKGTFEHLDKLLSQEGVSTSCDHGRFLASIILFYRCKNVIEIGVAYGDTTQWLCHATRQTEGHVYGFDCWDDHGTEGIIHGQKSTKEDIEKYLKYFIGANNFTLTKINTITNKKLLSKKLDEIGPIDLAFIDGGHWYEAIKSDFETVYPKLSSSGIIIFHDTLRIDGCRQFVHELRTKYYDGTFDIIDAPWGNFDRRVGLTMLFKRTFHNCGLKIDEKCGSTLDEEEIYSNEKKFVKNWKT